MEQRNLDALRMELSLKAKNGINFIISAALLWFGIAYIWTFPVTAYNKSILTFIVSATLLPVAFVFSKIFNTQWSVPGNPLDPLGLWFNFAQLFYFPFLVFVLLKNPTYFLMTYAIITGAHFFPYAWFYKETAYAVMAGVIPLGAMWMGLKLAPEKMFYIALFVGICLMVLFAWLYLSYQKKYRGSI